MSTVALKGCPMIGSETATFLQTPSFLQRMPEQEEAEAERDIDADGETDGTVDADDDGVLEMDGEADSVLFTEAEGDWE